jgi:hypothetical protein
MATFSNLVVKVSADTKKASKQIEDFTNKAARNSKRAGRAASDSMKKASDWTKRATGQNNKYVSSIARVRRAFYLLRFAAAGLFIGLGVSRAIKDMDKLAKTSQKLGIPVAQLQSIQFAAGLAGVGIEKTNLALQRMTRRVSEAANGTGEAQKALKELGIDAAKLNRMSPDQQFREIAKAMRQVTNQSDRLRLGFKLFDSEGVALINAMNDNLEKSEAQFKKLGIAITRIETGNIEKLVNSFSILATTVGNTFKKIVAQAAPALTETINSITGLISEFQLVPRTVALASSAIVIFAKTVTAALKLAERAASGLGLTFSLIESSLSDARIKKLSGEIKGRERALIKIKEDLKAASGLEKQLLESSLKNIIEGGTKQYEESLQTVKDDLKRAQARRGVIDSRIARQSERATDLRGEFQNIANTAKQDFSNLQDMGINKLTNASAKAAEGLTEFNKLINEMTGRGDGKSFANQVLGKEEGPQSVDQKLARALLTDIGNQIAKSSESYTPATFTNALGQDPLSGVKNFGKSSFGDGKSPLDGVVRNGSSFSQNPQETNIKITLDSDLLKAEIENGSATIVNTAASIQTN